MKGAVFAREIYTQLADITICFAHLYRKRYLTATANMLQLFWLNTDRQVRMKKIGLVKPVIPGAIQYTTKIAPHDGY